MKTPLSLTIDEPLFRRLHDHLFPGDDDEHGAVIAAGIVETPRGTRLLARELFLAQDGVDYVPSNRGYRALTADFVMQVSDHCARERLCYLAVHNHGGDDSVRFSRQDNESHERGYPALLDITGGPMGALVFARNAVAGDIWTREGRFELDYMTVVGAQIRRLYPHPRAASRKSSGIYDRHARLFGDIGQQILSDLKVGIIGLGGGGSLLSEWLARLGVGHIVAVDYDKVEITNLPRIVGATRWDALTPLLESQLPLLRWLGRKLSKLPARYKVHVARRVARVANPSVRYDAIVGDIMDEGTARLLVDADFLFLATDNIESRLMFNAICQQYLIPGVQIGAKVTVDPRTKIVDQITALTRLVMPYPGGGCLECNGFIPPDLLRQEALTEHERRAQRYVEDDTVTQPSVITLNAISAAPAANDLMMMFTGLYYDNADLSYLHHIARERVTEAPSSQVKHTCLDCSLKPKSRRARGDRMRLPYRARRRGVTGAFTHSRKAKRIGSNIIKSIFKSIRRFNHG